MKIRFVAVVISIFAALPAIAQQTTPQLPEQILGRWQNNEWGGKWSLQFKSEKQVIATLGRGGDSCGFSGVEGVVQQWDGENLVVEVKHRNCRTPVAFKLRRNGGEWVGAIDNDVRTVAATGK